MSNNVASDKYFDKYEQRGAYHWEWYQSNKHGYRDNVDFLLGHLPATGTVLDVGGGDGLISYKLFEKGLDVTCIDSNARSIELARQCFAKAIYGVQPWKQYPRRILSRLGIARTSQIARFEAGKAKFLIGSVFEMSIAAHDYVVCHEVIEHVPQPEALVRLIYKVMNRFAIISTPNVTNRDLHPLDYQGWTPATFSLLLEDYKFEFVKDDGWNMYVKLHK